ncbi:o-succinylbenzoate synthase, partial [Streptomyces anulatus]|uniref:o-succinylbenzoate synthase n=1 Tax=Streptomyces anulatus TaxID=1892 RepID=UPI00341EC120
MKITGIELRRIAMPLVAPFRTSFGTETNRDVLLLRAITPDAEGWAECVAMSAPLYSPEYVDGAADVLRRFLIPAVKPLLTQPGDHPGGFDINAVNRALHPFRGHQMAKSALETALLDTWLRTTGQSLGTYLGAAATTVPCGVSVGIMDSIPALLDAVTGYLDEGYRRIKLKIEPGWDLAPVHAVRERFGPDLLLQVDANAAYTLADTPHLAKLDTHDLLLIEQPLADDDLVQHAQLAAHLRTPVCLDESIHSADHAAAAITLGACSIINIKPGRVGGYLEARRIHDLARAHGIAVWCGGMLETGLGRAANLALAALPGFTLPGDTSGSHRYYAT